MVTSDSGLAGTMRLYGDDLLVTDEEAYSYCCNSDENDGANTYCSNFYARRPVDNCENFDDGISGM